MTSESNEVNFYLFHNEFKKLIFFKSGFKEAILSMDKLVNEPNSDPEWVIDKNLR